MELTRRELIEDFKPYRSRIDRPLPKCYAHVLLENVHIWCESPSGKREIVAHDKGLVRELIARDCKVELTTFNPSHAQRFGSKYDYDLHETMPYLDSEVHQAERLIKTLEFNRYMNFGIMTKDDAYRLSEAKLELISRN